MAWNGLKVVEPLLDKDYNRRRGATRSLPASLIRSSHTDRHVLRVLFTTEQRRLAPNAAAPPDESGEEPWASVSAWQARERLSSRRSATQAVVPQRDLSADPQPTLRRC